MIQRKTPLRRGGNLKRHGRLDPVSKRRRGELSDYRTLRIDFLRKRPVCEVWLAENGWEWIPSAPGAGPWYRRAGDASGLAVNDQHLLDSYGAKAATEVHHKNKRRGKMLLATEFWLAVSRENHERIEGDKKWARANGFLLDF